MAKLKKYTLADLMQDRKKAQQRAMSSMGDVYKFDTNGHLVDEPVEENKVEWGVQYHSTDGKLFDNTNCAINTSHHEGKCIAPFDASEMTANNYNTFTHSHPSNELQSASQDDRDFLSALFNGEIDNAFYSSIIDYWGVYDRFRNKIISR